MAKKEQITTTVTIDSPDFVWLKAKGYKATNLLRAKIQELRTKEFNEKSEEQETIRRLVLQRNKFLAFMEKEKLTDKFYEFEEDGTTDN